MAAESLVALDWNSIGVMVGTAAGTAAAVFFGYKATKAKPVPTTTNDVVLPAAAIIDMTPVKGMEKALGEIALCIAGIRADLRQQREDDEDRRDRAQLESDSFRRGQKYEQDRASSESGAPPRRKPRAD